MANKQLEDLTLDDMSDLLLNYIDSEEGRKEIQKKIIMFQYYNKNWRKNSVFKYLDDNVFKNYQNDGLDYNNKTFWKYVIQEIKILKGYNKGMYNYIISYIGAINDNFNNDDITEILKK